MTSNYQETRAALFRAAQLLEQAQAEIASAEAFAETGTTGGMRNAVIAATKQARQAVLSARRHVDDAAFDSRSSALDPELHVTCEGSVGPGMEGA